MNYEFNGDSYHDDRMFILYVCKVRAEVSNDDRRITIYHEDAPHNHVWGVVYYRNSGRYMPWKVDYFRAKEDAEAFFKNAAPKVPLVSLQGRSPEVTMTFDDYSRRVRENNWSEYNYRQFYTSGTNPCEELYQAL